MKPSVLTHAFERDCVCPSCADFREKARYRTYAEYINWTNGQLITGLQRVERHAFTHLAISFPVWKAAGLPVSKHHNPLADFHLKADA